MKKERKRKEFRKQRIRRLLAGAGAFLMAVLPMAEPMVVQAAESVTQIHAESNDDLWKSNASWTSISDNIWQLDPNRIETTGNLTVKTRGYLSDTGNGTQVLDYVEANGILTNGDGSTLTLYYDREAAGGIGQINGRTVGMKVVFSEIEGLECNGETVDGLGHCPVVEHFANIGAEMHKSGIVINENFWKGYTQHGIYSMYETYTLYYVDTGEVISQKGAHMTANSLNIGEGIIYHTQGQEAGDLKTTIRADHNLTNRNYGRWEGRNNDFDDFNWADSFTKNSVSFELCTDEPSFTMYSDSADYWHTYTVAPLVASIPDDPHKVGVAGDGLDVDQFEDVAMGQELTFEVRQKVQHLGITGSLAYKQFALVDQLPEELTYQGASVYYTMPDGTQQWLGEDAVQITESNGLVRAELTADYLSGGEGRMPYAMETYTLQVKAKVNEKAALKDRFENTGWSVVNHKDQEQETVPVTPVAPALSIVKSVEKDTVNVKDEDSYTLVATQTVNGGMAKNVYLKDALKQEGVKYVKDSFQVLDKDGKDITKNCVITVGGDNRSVTIQTKQNLLYNQKITVKYRVLFEDNKLAGQTVQNTATTGADNAPEVTDDENVKVLKPELSITKESPKYEYKVGDKVEYTVKVTQSVDKAIARNVVISDVSLPEGLKVNEAKASGVEGVKLVKEGTGWKVTAPNLKKGETITITFDCTAAESVNTKETVNTAKASADNADPKQDVEEVFVNTAKLAIEKKVSKEEWKVGDTVDYTVDVTNTQKGSIANNVVISDITLPKGLTLTGEATITGVPATVNRPVKNDKNVHGEVKEEAVTSSVAKDEKSNSWTAKLSALPADVKVTVTFTCKVEAAVNGMEVINTAHTKADNAPDVKDDAKIWINSPELSIQKDADMKKVKIGDVITYTVIVNNQQTGTVARNVTIRDQIDEAASKWVKLQKNSIVLLDSKGKKIDDAEISVQGNSFVIETKRNLIHPDSNYQIWNQEQSKEPIDSGKLNPLDLKTESQMTVEYQVKVVSDEASGETIHNVAVVNSDENIPKEDDENVVVNGPHLEVEKTSDRTVYALGTTGTYEVTVRQTREGYQAKDVVVADNFAQKGMEIVADSFHVKVNKKEITPKSITLNETKTGYTMETGQTLTDEDKMVITYEVEFSAVTIGEKLKNTVVAKGSNTNEAEDDHTVVVEKVVPELRLKKTSANKTVGVGETNTYKLTVQQVKDEATAEQVYIKDALDMEGVRYVKDSFHVLNPAGEDITKDCEIKIAENQRSFTILTKQNLAMEEILTVTYEVLFENANLVNQTVNNTAVAGADNAPEVTDDATVDVIAPELQLEKKAERETVGVGEKNSYTLVVTETESKVTAKQVYVKDTLDQEGVSYVKDSFKVLNPAGEDITKDCEITIAENQRSFAIQTKQDLAKGEKLTVSYEVLFESMELAGQKVKNTAIAGAENTKEVTDEAEVKVISPVLKIEKKAEPETVAVGERGAYTIVVTETKEGVVAKRVYVEDSLDQEGVSYVKDSFKVLNPAGEDITKDCEIQIAEDQRSVTIQTGQDLAMGETLTVTYAVLFQNAELANKKVINTAIAWADNAERVQDIAEVMVKKGKIDLTKTVDQETTKEGDTRTYTLVASNPVEKTTVKQVVLLDDLKYEGAKIRKDSFKITGPDGADITKDCEIKVAENLHSFEILTKKDLAHNEKITVVYQVLMEKAGAGDTIENVATVKADNVDPVTATAKVTVPQKETETAANPKTGLHSKAGKFAAAALGFLILGAGAYVISRKRKEKDKI